LYKDFEVGSIRYSSPNNLKKFEIKGKCLECSYLNLCGGRCLYWNYSNLWPDEGDEMICDTIKFLIDNLKGKENEIKNLIKRKIIKLKDFDYEKYFGPEIIP
jgi:sulfatase maturation enzyme AslB (radical SAM superfamily)